MSFYFSLVFVGFILNGYGYQIMKSDIVGIISSYSCNEGEWLNWYYCNDGAYAFAGLFDVEKDCGGLCDDTAGNDFRLICNPFNNWNKYGELIPSNSPNDYGNSKYNITCSVNAFANGIQERNDGGNCDFGTTDVRLFCNDGGSAGSINGLPWGSWRDGVYCPENTLVCGSRIKYNKNPSFFEYNGMTGIQLACCSYTQYTYNPSNTPSHTPTVKTIQPSLSPSKNPSHTPSNAPTIKTIQPSVSPSKNPIENANIWHKQSIGLQLFLIIISLVIIVFIIMCIIMLVMCKYYKNKGNNDPPTRDFKNNDNIDSDIIIPSAPLNEPSNEGKPNEGTAQIKYV